MKEISRIRRVARNSILLGLQQVAINILSVVVVAYIARKLGGMDYGVFSLAFTFTGFFIFLGHLGLRTLTIREVAKDIEHANDYLGKIIPARLFLVTLMTAVIPLAAFVFNYEKNTIIIIAIAALATMFEQLSRIISDIFQAYEEMGKVAFRDVIVRLFTGFASIAVLYCGYGLVAVSWIYVLGAFIGFIFNVLLYNNRFSMPVLQFDHDFILKNVKIGLSFMVIGMASSLYANVDVLIISKMLDMNSVGVYNVSANLFYRLGFIGDAVATAIFPAIAQIYFHDKSEANNILTKSLSVILIISIPMAVGGLMLADEIINLIYGDGYASSSDVFRILISSVPFAFLNMQLYCVLGAIKLQGILLRLTLLLLVVNFTVNIVIVPIYGILGAACTKLITEFIAFIIILRISLKHFNISETFKNIKIIIFPICTMTIFVYFTSSFGAVIAILAGAFSFIAVLYFFGKKELYSWVTVLRSK